MFLGLSSFIAVCADLPEKWRAWQYSRAIEEPDLSDSQPAELTLPWEMFGHCRTDCADLRIIDSHGQQIPYVLEEKYVRRIPENHGAAIIENSFVTGRYTQVIADLGDKPPNYDRVRVETGRPDFIVWAEVALSDDAKTWRIVEARAPIARFRSRAVDGTQSIPIQALASRYVRVRISDPDAQFPVSGISVLHEETFSFPKQSIQAAFAEEKPADSTESVWSATLNSANQPISDVEIKTDTPEFYRALRIAGSTDGQDWQYRGSGTIYRYKQDDRVRESLHVEFPEFSGDRFVRVEVINGNDQPLSGPRIAIAGIPRTLLFRPIAGQRFRLIYGNEKADAPRYDLGNFVNSGASKPVYRVLSLGSEEKTTNYQDPRPFTERHPEILWSALGLAVALIGFTAWKTLRSAGASASRTQV